MIKPNTKWKKINQMHMPNLLCQSRKKIGCAAKEANSGHLILNLCLYGPEGDTKSYFEKRGTPGSKCDPGYFSNDGLCSIYVEKKHGSVNGTMEKDENSGSCNFSFLMITVLLSMIMIF
ncbi:hypothetical protein B9Z55_007971 [Caenorhabditis nigoni]|uniref:SCP domain-containing protein n=3 Tax=Caenorhabditis nigoni TaxID=1611254 RepID=A0A2G5VC09_9PELO|nr:hypothetical protein B9Z55_007971 [Caenorhabditis nigoni]